MIGTLAVDGWGVIFGTGMNGVSETISAPSYCTVKPRLHDTTCCQTGCQAGLITG